MSRLLSDASPAAVRVARRTVWLGIGRAQVQGWRNRGLIWDAVRAAALLGPVCLAGALATMDHPGLRSAHFSQACLGLAAVMMLGLWSLFVSGLLQQNRRRHARLVPGQLTALRQMMVGGWLVFMLPTFAVVAWFGFDPLADYVTVAACVALLAVTVRWPLLWAIVWLLPVVGRGLGAALPSRADFLGAAWPLVPVVVTLALAAGLSLLLHEGGAGHRGEESSRARRGSPGSQDRAVGIGDFRQTAVRWLSAPYFIWFEVVTSRPGSGVWPRLMLALGPAVHGSIHAAWGMVLLLVAYGVLSVLTSRGWLPASGLRGAQLWGPVLGIVSTVINPVLGSIGALHRTRREQALMGLLPGVPRGVALNRALALRLLLRFGAAWCIGLGALLMLGRCAPDHASTLLVVAIGMVPSALLTCFDVSRMAQPVMSMRLWLTSAVPMMLPMAVAALHRAGGLSVGALATLVLLPTALVFAWRWRGLGRMPGAFPAGRLARVDQERRPLA